MPGWQRLFDAVGAILVVALMIAPPAAAYLLTDNLKRMIVFSALIGVASAISGYWVAHALDVSIAGCMASMSGVMFLLAFLLAPNRGILAIVNRRRRQKWEFAIAMLVIHLFTHEDLPEADTECRYEHLTEHLNWSEHFASEVVEHATRDRQVRLEQGLLKLTEGGREMARSAIIHWAPAPSR